ncbi:ShlB/FhaC/HecB family hemolysin secretion/activation protein [Aquicoccus sp. SCR17]|nr:ShlB/FhaC/HecB family hemolysin secretion/activation protein [Carideicomes alvinocaridis]
MKRCLSPVLAALFSAGLLLPAQTEAQTASEVTPESFTPPLRNLNGAVVFSGQPGTEAPAGSEAIGITLSGVEIEGALPSLSAANARYRERLTRGRIPVSELFEATADLEGAYSDAGFVLTRVVLPQQSLRDGGVLRVEVVNGFVEQIDASSVPPEVRSRVEGLTEPLLKRSGVTLRELERQLLLAGDVSGVALNTALATGAQPGGTQLALDADYRRVTGFVGADNFTDDDLGRPALNFGIELNSALGLGETVYGRLSFTPDGVLSDDPRYRILAAGAVVPLGMSGLTMNVELTSSRTRPDDPLAPTESRFDRQALRLVYPFIRSRQVNLSGQVALEHLTDEQDLVGGASLYADELTVLRLGGNASYLQESGAFTEGGLTLSQGLDMFGARTAAEAAASGTPLSRAGADAEFTKLTGSIRHQRALSDALALTVSGRFQTSFGDPLVTSEQFGIIGPNELSSFDSGAVSGDSGWVVRAEMSMPQQVTLAGKESTVSPYVFAAYGGVHLEQPTAVEQSYTEARSYGIGLDILTAGGSPFRSGSVRIEYGRGERSDGGQDDNRLSLSGNLRF